MKQQEIASRIRRVYPAEYDIGLTFDQCGIKVKANRKEIIKFLQEYFEPFVADFDTASIQITCHDAPVLDVDVFFKINRLDYGKPVRQEEWADLIDGRIVRNRLTGMIYGLGGSDHIAVGPCVENLSHVVNFINSRYIEWQLCRGCLLGHAAGVVINGKGLALAGFSGMGKSTLALHLMSRGAVFVSNNRLMIRKINEQLYMYGVAKLPRVNPGTILHNSNLIGLMPKKERSTYSKLSNSELWTLEHKYDVPIERCFGKDRVVLSSPMHVLIILNWHVGDEPTKYNKVDLAERTDLLPAFMKTDDVFLFPTDKCHMPEFSPQNYIEYLSRCLVFEVTGNRDFEKAVDVCMSYLERY